MVVTNQSGVARGFFGESDVERVHAMLAHHLAADDATIDAFYFCTHLEMCDCRKPLTGMVERAVRERNIDLRRSVVFGDRGSDIELAHATSALQGSSLGLIERGVRWSCAYVYGTVDA